jgi:hypothetical protein
MWFARQFCFPPGEMYPRSTGRLIVFALYGPFNEEGNLTCGFRGSHVLSSVELESMIDDIDQEDIVSVYVVRDTVFSCGRTTDFEVIVDFEWQPSKGLSTYEKQEVLRSSGAAAKRLPTMSRAQVSAFLAKLPTDASGTISFHDLQEYVGALVCGGAFVSEINCVCCRSAVQKQREKRLQEMKRMYPTITSASAEDEGSLLKVCDATARVVNQSR